MNGHNEMDIQQATNALLDLYSANGSDLSVHEAVQVSEDEPYI
jgi:hypothetical protein